MVETAAIAEQIRTPEVAKASPSLMLHIANGEFSKKTAELTKDPTEVARNSFDILESQHQKVQSMQEKQQHEYNKQILKNRGYPEEKITSEQLRHMHMVDWAKAETIVITAMFHHNPGEQSAMVTALAKLNITISTIQGENAGLADQLYKTASDTSGTPGKFYENFCSSGNINERLLQVLDEPEIVALKIFLVSTLGSNTAYDALLATKQTQDALKASRDFSSANITALDDKEQSVLRFFQEGEKLPKPWRKENPVSASESIRAKPDDITTVAARPEITNTVVLEPEKLDNESLHTEQIIHTKAERKESMPSSESSDNIEWTEANMPRLLPPGSKFYVPKSETEPDSAQLEMTVTKYGTRAEVEGMDHVNQRGTQPDEMVIQYSQQDPSNPNQYPISYVVPVDISFTNHFSTPEMRAKSNITASLEE